MEIPERVKKLQKKPAPILSAKFGPLQGIRVLCTGSIAAGPHGAQMLADLGAEMIFVENPGVGDLIRRALPQIKLEDGRRASAGWADSGRNRLSMELDLRIHKNPHAREVFLSLIKASDIWIENLVWLEQRYGITDELILNTNPSIVIVHESGCGKPEFGGESPKWWHAAYDIIGQSYGGFTNLTGEPDAPPTRLEPYTADYITANFVSLGALMGYIAVQRTGKGQVIDVAQFESIARVMAGLYPDYLNTGNIPERSGNKADSIQPYGIFPAADGYVAIGACTIEDYRRFLQAMTEATGINPTDYPVEECSFSREKVNSPRGAALDKLLQNWVKNHTKAEVNVLFRKHHVACSPVNSIKEVAEDPHWIERGNFVECIEQTTQKKVKVFAPIPKASKTPGKVWRGAPTLGQDTDRILSGILDFTPAEITQLRTEKVVCR